MNELWQEVPGWKGLYEVSDQGRVRSLDHLVPFCARGTRGQRTYPGKLLKLLTDRDGYKRICFCKENRKRTRQVHALVLEAFVGTCPEGMQVCHNNGDPGDNRLSNLRYDTIPNNHADKKLHGTHQIGEKGPSAKLTEDNVRYIKQCLQSPYRGINADLGRKFGVTKECISRIKQGRTWAHVSP